MLVLNFRKLNKGGYQEGREKQDMRRVRNEERTIGTNNVFILNQDVHNYLVNSNIYRFTNCHT